MSKKTKYIGWVNVPEGVLVRTKGKTSYEYYIKSGEGHYSLLYGNNGKLKYAEVWSPDEYSRNGKYTAVELPLALR